MKPPSVPFTSRGRSFVVFLRKRDANNPAAPYYFRVDGRPLSTKQTTAEAAIREAKARLELRAQAPGDYAAALETLKARAGRTVGQLVSMWARASYSHPNGQPRTISQCERLEATLRRGLDWWSSQSVATTAGPTLNAYCQWRQGHCRTGAVGTRAVDMELAALSTCFAWAVAFGHTSKNPFRVRPRFHANVKHHSSQMPESDEELHSLCRILLGSTRPGQVVAGAQLLFQALTGLRSGEPGFLRWDAIWSNGRPQPGCRYPTRSGDSTAIVELLAVHREKNGHNPAVHIHTALRDFLAAWAAYSRPRWSSAWYFPDPADPTQPLIRVRDNRRQLSDALQAAVEALGLPARTPHAMRAFYVRVRRSQAFDDSRIAVELGHGGGPEQIVRVYGERHAIVGDGRFDWLPDPLARPAWTVLSNAANSPIVPLDTEQEIVGGCPTLSNILPAMSGENQKNPLTINAEQA